MPRVCRIKILLDHPLAQPIQVFTRLREGGWQPGFAPDGRIQYLPFGEDDDDWQEADSDAFARVLLEMERKVAAQQRVGLVMHYDATSCSISVLPPYDRIECHIDRPGRKRLTATSAITDYSWYVRHITPVIVADERMISEVHCHDMA